MSDLRTAAQQALEALHVVLKDDYRLPYEKIVAATDALKAALAEPTPFEDVVTHGSAWSKDGKRIDPMSVYAEPVQEPMAWKDKIYETLYHQNFGNSIPLYAAPPQRKPLTEEEIDSIWDSEKAFADIYAIARAIERAHGIV